MARKNTMKQKLVIVNEFTVGDDEGKGSRGSTPGMFVMRYMARKGATEPVAPIVRGREDAYIVRYMARKEATERLDTTNIPVTRQQARNRISHVSGLGGVAFSADSVSLSDEELWQISDDIQRLFNKGHTVMKTVLSFRHDYLVQHGIVPADLEVTRPGEYRGYVDQMKLRQGIMHGMARMGYEFDDLRYAGVIQVDTEHVHCHLAMVDAGHGTRKKNGEQKGMLTKRHFSLIRRGVDSYLDEKKTVQHLSSAVSYERQNVTSYVKSWAYRTLQKQTLAQFLVACLPEDRSLWRASSHAVSMQKPHRLVRELIDDVLSRPGSPLAGAKAQIQAYAAFRQKNEGLTRAETAHLVETGEETLIQRSMNTVYQMLRSLPQNELTVRTPMLGVMSMDYESLAAKSQQASANETSGTALTTGQNTERFAFRLRSYRTRLMRHAIARRSYLQLAHLWEEADERGEAAEPSRALYVHYRTEADYHGRLVSKYRHFLPFHPTYEQGTEMLHPLYPLWHEERHYRDALTDDTLLSLSPAAAAKRAETKHQIAPGDAALFGLPEGAGIPTLEARLAEARAKRVRTQEDIEARLSESGFVLAETDTGSLAVEVGVEHPFPEVKALDLHDLGWDFTRDVEVGPVSLGRFSQAAHARRQSVYEAAEYLERSGQSAQIASLPLTEIGQMYRLARRLTDEYENSGEAHLLSLIARQRREDAKRSATIRLDRPVLQEIETALVADVVPTLPQVPGVAPQEPETRRAAEPGR